MKKVSWKSFAFVLGAFTAILGGFFIVDKCGFYLSTMKNRKQADLSAR